MNIFYSESQPDFGVFGHGGMAHFALGAAYTTDASDGPARTGFALAYDFQAIVDDVGITHNHTVSLVSLGSFRGRVGIGVALVTGNGETLAGLAGTFALGTHLRMSEHCAAILEVPLTFNLIDAGALLNNISLGFQAGIAFF